MRVQHVALQQCPFAQTVFAGWLLYPEGQVKVAHVGGGVVVTVVVMGGGVVVTVVTIKVQHVYLQQCPFAQTVFAGRLLYPEGQVKVAQVGGGVVVTVVTRSQHTCGQHFGSFALPHMMTPAFWA
jgi:hypothetical protein